MILTGLADPASREDAIAEEDSPYAILNMMIDTRFMGLVHLPRNAPTQHRWLMQLMKKTLPTHY
jgi:hypothetical protein